MTSPAGERRHSGVRVVPQLVHVWPAERGVPGCRCAGVSKVPAGVEGDGCGSVGVCCRCGVLSSRSMESVSSGSRGAWLAAVETLSCLSMMEDSRCSREEAVEKGKVEGDEFASRFSSGER
jgi:hypothetical protein